MKSHPFFTGVAWDELDGSSAPHSHEFIIKPEKDIKPKTKSINQVENNNRNTLTIIKQDIKEKKSPWFHYNTRKVVLDNAPKIEYIDPSKNIVKVL